MYSPYLARLPIPSGIEYESNGLCVLRRLTQSAHTRDPNVTEKRDATAGEKKSFHHSQHPMEDESMGKVYKRLLAIS